MIELGIPVQHLRPFWTLQPSCTHPERETFWASEAHRQKATVHILVRWAIRLIERGGHLAEAEQSRSVRLELCERFVLEMVPFDPIARLQELKESWGHLLETNDVRVRLTDLREEQTRPANRGGSTQEVRVC